MQFLLIIIILMLTFPVIAQFGSILSVVYLSTMFWLAITAIAFWMVGAFSD